MSEATYARAGVTPGWQYLEVVDLESNALVRDVFEVNTVEGWLERAVRDGRGRLIADPAEARIARERISGRFEIRRKAR